MKKLNVSAIAAIIIALVIGIILIGKHLVASQPVLIQGTVECGQVKASSKIPGRIVKMNVASGDYVKKGDVLYTLSTPELDAKLEQAEALRSAAQAIDDKAMAGARKQQIEAAHNLWKKANVGLDLAEKTLKRVENLYKEGVVPEQKLDEARANYNAMAETASAAQQQYLLAVEGAQKEDKDAAAAKVRQAQGAVKEVNSYLSEAKICSPIDGQISTVVSDEGELVGSGYPVVTILNLASQKLTFNIKETMLSKIQEGKHVETYIPALDRTIEVVVKTIAVQADFATWNATRTQGSFDIRTFAVKMEPVCYIEGLRPGMSAIINWSNLE